VNDRKPIEVELYVCDACEELGIETVGKLPQGRGSKYHAACTGPIGHEHKQKFMHPRRFREVIES